MTQTSQPFFKSRQLMSVLLSSGIALLPLAHADNKNSQDNIKIDDKVEFKNSLPVTLEEVAAMDVLGKICPPLLGKNKRFDQGFRTVLNELMPNFPDPVLALKALQSDPEYQTKLKEAHSDASNVSVNDNREICLEIAQYQQDVQKNKK